MRKNFTTNCISQVNFSGDIQRQSVTFGGKKLKLSEDVRWQFRGDQWRSVSCGGMKRQLEAFKRHSAAKK